MDLLSVINTGLTVINDVRGFSRSVKQAESLRGRLQTKLSSTQLILDNLKKLVEDIGLAENDEPSDSSGAVDPDTGGLRSLSLQNNAQLETLQKTVEDIQKRLAVRNNSHNTKTIAGRIKRVSRREKEEQEILLFLDDLSEVKENASVLCGMLSM